MGNECSSLAKTSRNAAVANCPNKNIYDSKEIGSFYSIASSEDSDSAPLPNRNLVDNISEYDLISNPDDESHPQSNHLCKSYECLDLTQRTAYRNNIEQSDSEDDIKDAVSRWRKTVDGRWVEIDQVRDQGNIVLFKENTIRKSATSKYSSIITTCKKGSPEFQHITAAHKYSAKQHSSDEDTEYFTSRWQKIKDCCWIETDKMRNQKVRWNSCIKRNSGISQFSSRAGTEFACQSKSLASWCEEALAETDSLTSSFRNKLAPYKGSSNSSLSNRPCSDLSSNCFIDEAPLSLKPPKINIEEVFNTNISSRKDSSNRSLISESTEISAKKILASEVNSFHIYKEDSYSHILLDDEFQTKEEVVVPSILDFHEELQTFQRTTEQSEVSRYYDSGIEVTSSIIKLSFHSDPIVKKQKRRKKKKKGKTNSAEESIQSELTNESVQGTRLYHL